MSVFGLAQRGRTIAVRPPWKLIRIASFYAGILLVWHLVAVADIWPSYVFPSPSGVWAAYERIWDSGQLTTAVQTTMTRMVVGYSLSIIVGLALGVLMGSSRWVDETVGSVVLGLQSLPSIAWFPLALMWFGLNEKAVIFVVLMGSVNSVAISARLGIHSIPPILTRASRMFGGHWWQVLLFVTLPAMLPSMVQGLKLGWSFAWRSLLAAELLFVSMSLGFLLQTGRDLNNVNQVVAMMLVIIVAGVLVDRLIFGRMEAWVRERWGLAGS